MPLISLNLRKIAHFWIENSPVPSIKLWMGTNSKSITRFNHFAPFSPDAELFIRLCYKCLATYSDILRPLSVLEMAYLLQS